MKSRLPKMKSGLFTKEYKSDFSFGTTILLFLLFIITIINPMSYIGYWIMYKVRKFRGATNSYAKFSGEMTASAFSVISYFIFLIIYLVYYR